MSNNTSSRVILINRGGLVALALYLGVGFLCYALFGGGAGTVHWESPWLYAWLLAWPVVLFATFFIWAVIVCVALCLIGWAVIAVLETDWFASWRMKRVRDAVLRAEKKRGR